MTPELKAAADKYKAGSCSLGVAQALADAYLAEHDETPVAGDEQWLREHGFAPDDFGDLCCGKVFITAGCLFVSDPSDDLEGIEVSVLICNNATRGDVLRLLSVVEKDGE